jgi:hypothetical protein
MHKYFAGHVCFLKNPNHEHPHYDTLFGLVSHKTLTKFIGFCGLTKDIQIFNESHQLLGRWLGLLGFVASHLHCVCGCHPL